MAKTISKVCSCGDATPHVVARRKTSDGKSVLGWSDGELTFSFGWRIRGGRVGVDRMWRELENVCLYTVDELRARLAAERGRW